MTTASIDYTPLKRTVHKRDIAEFRRNPQNRSLPSPGLLYGLALLFTIIGVVCAVVAVGLDNGFAMAGVLPAILAAVACLVVGSENRLVLKLQVKLARFCEANGLSYSYKTRGNAGYTGLLFTKGVRRALYHRMTLPTKERGLPAFETGVYQYQTGDRYDGGRWRYIRIELERSLPHMFLDATQNSAFSVSFRRDQKVNLEGNFPDYFTLYAPKGYERDARYIFTPDLMALLINHSAKFDVEIEGNHIYFYQLAGENMRVLANQELLEHIMAIVREVGNKAYRTTDQYRDEKLADGQHQSTRLKKTLLG